MAHDAHGAPQLHMGLPLPNGKLATWLFLVTEIMFFTALIGTYLILRNGTPSVSPFRWPTPKDVHLLEWVGAGNTFVLICSSLTVVLAHYYAVKREYQKATVYVLITLLLGGLFLVVKYFEYKSKFEHDILPGHIGELITAPGLTLEREKQMHAVGMQYVERVRAQLQAMTKDESEGSTKPGVQDAFHLLADMTPSKFENGDYKPPLTPAEVGTRVNRMLHDAHDKHHAELPLSPAIPFGNLWASCY